MTLVKWTAFVDRAYITQSNGIRFMYNIQWKQWRRWYEWNSHTVGRNAERVNNTADNKI